MASSKPELGTEALVYIEKVRRATKRFGEQGAEDVRGALQAVRNAAHFDVEAPPSSARPEVALVKTGVRRLSAWYMRYLATQLNAFAADLVRLGEALAAKTERLDEGSDEMATRLRIIEERLGRLEAGPASVPTRPAPSGATRPAPSGATRPAPSGATRKPRRARES